MNCDHGVNDKYCRVCKRVEERSRREEALSQIDKMTDEQVSNWRGLLVETVGPYALLMPKEDVIKYAKKIQEILL